MWIFREGIIIISIIKIYKTKIKKIIIMQKITSITIY